MPPTGRLSRSSRIGMTARPSNPLPLIAGIGGGLLLLILIIAAAASSGGDRRAPPRRAPEPPPPIPAPAVRSPEDTGPIMFICSNSALHTDKEYLITECPSCPARARFYTDASIPAYRCLSCRQVYPNERIKCPDCGKVPRAHRIKHRPG